MPTPSGKLMTDPLKIAKKILSKSWYRNLTNDKELRTLAKGYLAFFDLPKPKAIPTPDNCSLKPKCKKWCGLC